MVHIVNNQMLYLVLVLIACIFYPQCVAKLYQLLQAFHGRSLYILPEKNHNYRQHNTKMQKIPNVTLLEKNEIKTIHGLD